MATPIGVQQLNIGGSVGTGVATTDSPVFMAGWDATVVRALLTDTSGRIQIAGGAAVGTPTAGNPILIGGQDVSGNTRIAGINTAQQVLVNIEGQKATYRASVSINTVSTTGLLFTIAGSGTKTVRVTRFGITVFGANALVPVTLIKYSSAPTGGTSAAITAVPLDSNFAAATASVKTWAAGNPTPGTAVGDVLDLDIGASSAGGNYFPNVDAIYGDKNGSTIVLRGTAQVLGLIVGTGVALNYNLYFEWTEE